MIDFVTKHKKWVIKCNYITIMQQDSRYFKFSNLEEVQQIAEK